MDCNEQILKLITSRMEKGKKQYGHGLIQDAGYNWVKEALEEALDLSVYISAKLIQVERERARKIFGPDLSESELDEWVMMSLERAKTCSDDTEGEGETIEIKK